MTAAPPPRPSRPSGNGTVCFDATAKIWFAKVPFSYRANGRIAYRRRSARTKALANAARAELLAEREQRGAEVPQVPTLAAFADQHLTTDAAHRLSPTTISGYRFLLAHHVYPHFGNRGIDEITTTDLLVFFDALRHDHSASLVNHVRAAMSRVLSAGVAHGLIDQNPVRRTPKMRTSQDEPTIIATPWSLEECAKALAASSGTRFALFLPLAIHTGMRHGELLGLRWDDFNFDEATVSIQRTSAILRGTPDGQHNGVFFKAPKTKSGYRRLQLPPSVVSLAREHHHRHVEQRSASAENWNALGQVFVDLQGRPISTATNRVYFARFLAANGLRHIRVHDIRHGFAKHALELGVDLPSISRTLGHGSLAITFDIYGHAAKGLEHRATSALAGYFAGGGKSLMVKPPPSATDEAL